MRQITSPSKALRVFVVAAVAVLATAGSPPAGAAPAPEEPPGAAGAPASLGGDVNAGYLLVSDTGGVQDFGGGFFGSIGRKLAKPVVGIASTPSAQGYWLAASDGGIFTFGDAQFFGSTGHIELNKPVVGLAATPDGDGYWLVAEDGGIFTFGKAAFYGSTGDQVLNQPIVGMAATPSGEGYWFVASDGGIFTFGDAPFHGSLGDQVLNQPIVGMAATPSGEGYWLVASDGGIFTFGDAPFHGSAGSVPLVKPIVDMAATPNGEGYWLVAEDGGVFTYGKAPFKGSGSGTALNGRVVDLLPQGGDVTAPMLHSLSFSPTSVDTSAGPQTITVTARITDDLAGVFAWEDHDPASPAPIYVNWLWLSSPSGLQLATGALTERISGNAFDGVYQTDVVLPAYSERGTWTVTSLELGDKAGNKARLAAVTLAQAGYPTTFTQLGAGDTTPPAVDVLSIEPASVDTSAGARQITVTARIRDDFSGAWVPADNTTGGTSIVRFGSASTPQIVEASFGERISGDHRDGIYRAVLTVPIHSAPGTWSLAGRGGIYLLDRAGNGVSVPGSALAAAGDPTEFNQSGAGDTTPPTVHSLSMSPNVVDTSSAPQTITVRARIRDDLAGGFAAENDAGPDGLWGQPSRFYFASPSGFQMVEAYFNRRISGDHLDGVYETTITLPAHSEQGTWSLLAGLTLADRLGNVAQAGRQALVDAGYPTTVEVIRTG
jgi:hypothetical protein